MGYMRLLERRRPALIVAGWITAGWITGACIIHGPCLAQQPAPAAPATGAPATGAPAIGGQVDIQRSRAYVRVGAKGFGHEHGVEGRIASGSIRLGVEQQAGQIVFDMKSFVCDTQAVREVFTLNGNVDQSTQLATTKNMTGAAVLDAGRFPTATFVIRSSRAFPKKQPTDPAWYQLEGDFTLHGVTRPLKFNATAEPVDRGFHVRGAFDIFQTQFGITPYSRAFGAVGVADELKIRGELWLVGQ